MKLVGRKDFFYLPDCVVAVGVRRDSDYLRSRPVVGELGILRPIASLYCHGKILMLYGIVRVLWWYKVLVVKCSILYDEV